MSMQNILAFADALAKDAALRRELAATIGTAIGRDAYARAADFVRGKGFHVTTDEVAMGFAVLRDAERGRPGLKDAELDILSGGKDAGSRPDPQAEKRLSDLRGFFRRLFR